MVSWDSCHGGCLSWVTRTFLRGRGLACRLPRDLLSGRAVVGRVDTGLSPLLQFSTSYSNRVYSANCLVLFTSYLQPCVNCLLGAKLSCSTWHFILNHLAQTPTMSLWTHFTDGEVKIDRSYTITCSGIACEQWSRRTYPHLFAVLCSFIPSIPWKLLTYEYFYVTTAESAVPQAGLWHWPSHTLVFS